MMSPAWYAVQVRPRHEKAVLTGLVQRGYEAFLPLYRSRRKWSDRFQDVDLPLFQAYVFCRLDINRRLPVLTIPGVIRFIGTGKTPVPVDEDEMIAIHSVINSGLLVRPFPFIKVGQSVLIEEGPLRNIRGILSQIDGADQLVVSISLLQRSVGVAIPRHWIRPVESSLSTAGHHDARA
jgi:transcription antitermination factor NusG